MCHAGKRLSLRDPASALKSGESSAVFQKPPLAVDVLRPVVRKHDWTSKTSGEQSNTFPSIMRISTMSMDHGRLDLTNPAATSHFRPDKDAPFVLCAGGPVPAKRAGDQLPVSAVRCA